VKFAAIVTKAIPTHSGPGNSNDTEEYVELVTFANKEAMEEWILRSTTGYSKPTFKLIRYEELNYETTVSVKVTPLSHWMPTP
jgi:hypothetical protein